jgi:hypothetical protein
MWSVDDLSEFEAQFEDPIPDVNGCARGLMYAVLIWLLLGMTIFLVWRGLFR